MVLCKNVKIIRCLERILVQPVKMEKGSCPATIYLVPYLEMLMTGNGAEKGLRLSLKIVYTTLVYWQNFLSKFDLNSLPKEFNLLTISYPEFLNCRVV